MNITDEMLTAAITKAVEAGLLPRRSLREDVAEARALMRDILKAALTLERPAVPASKSHQLVSSRYHARDGIVVSLPSERPEHLYSLKRQGSR